MNIDIELQRARLESLSLSELRAEYEKVFREPTTSRHARYIIKRILWQMQARQRGGLSTRAIKLATRLAQNSTARLTEPAAAPSEFTPPRPARKTLKLLPGTKISRIYKGEEFIVEATETGYKFRGEFYTSLSAVAKIITGSHWNGKLFFGLTKRNRSTK